MKNYNLSAEWLESTRKETFFRDYFLKDGNAYYCHSLTMLVVLQTSLSEAERQSEHQPKLGETILTADEYYEILDIYTKAYNTGRAIFRDKYLIDKNVLYGINADAFIRQLDKNLNNIWIPESQNNSTIVSEKVISKMGNAAGHWHELTDLYNENKELFEKYEIKVIDDTNPVKTFADLLNGTDEDKKQLIEKIKPLLVDAGGVRVANLLYCMEDMKLLKFSLYGRMNNKVYQIIRKEFSLDFSDESANKQMRFFEQHRDKTDRKTNLIQKDFQFIKEAIK